LNTNYDKKILVTGGAGFLGSFLCERLINENNHVICMDNFYTGQINNIKHLLENSNFQLVTHDVVVPFYHEVDEIYNLACPASPVHYQFDPIKTNKTSVLGAINCLNLAKKLKAKIFQASTSEVYGDPNVHPQSENYWGNVNTTGIRSCYDEGKRCAETFFIDYKRTYNLDIKIGRIFNTYGPRMHPNDGRVVSNFIIQALKNKDITIYGDGNQTRSFCYCDDLIESFILLMKTNSHFYGPVNLGNPGEFTIVELAEMIISLTNSNSKLSFELLPKDDPKQRCPDITLAKKELNWQPRINLKDGLIKTINYFKSII
jgi:UDP-glucuronate decarboxylase